MSKIYSLLRNNKQLGPFTLEELIAQNLKPMDLVWVEGRSAGWRYPTEIDLLKNHFTATSISSPSLKSTSGSQPSPGPQSQKESSKGNHIYVSLPQGPRVQSSSEKQAVASPVSTSSEDAGTEPSFEERVERMRQRIAEAAQTETTDNKEEISTKYSRSLDDIKEEYTSWLYRQKHKKNFKISRKQLFLGTGAVLIFFIGAMTYYLTSGGSESSLPAATLVKAVENKVEKPVQEQNASLTPNEKTKRPADKPDRMLRVSESGNTIQAKTKKKASAPDKKPGDSPLQAKKTQAEVPVSTLPVKEETVASKPAAPQKAVPLSKQIDIRASLVQGRKGIGGVELILHNNSEQLLKVVAVDIFYQKGSNVVHRETVYFSNVAPGRTQTIKAPGNKKADGFYYQLGLISSSDGGLYVSR